MPVRFAALILLLTTFLVGQACASTASATWFDQVAASQFSALGQVVRVERPSRVFLGEECGTGLGPYHGFLLEFKLLACYRGVAADSIVTVRVGDTAGFAEWGPSVGDSVVFWGARICEDHWTLWGRMLRIRGGRLVADAPSPSDHSDSFSVLDGADWNQAQPALDAALLTRPEVRVSRQLAAIVLGRVGAATYDTLGVSIRLENGYVAAGKLDFVPRMIRIMSPTPDGYIGVRGVHVGDLVWLPLGKLTGLKSSIPEVTWSQRELWIEHDYIAPLGVKTASIKRAIYTAGDGSIAIRKVLQPSGTK